MARRMVRDPFRLALTLELQAPVLDRDAGRCSARARAGPMPRLPREHGRALDDRWRELGIDVAKRPPPTPDGVQESIGFRDGLRAVDEYGHRSRGLVDSSAPRAKGVERAVEPRCQLVVRDLEIDDRTDDDRECQAVAPTQLRVECTERREQGVVEWIEVLVERVHACGHHADVRVTPDAADDRTRLPRWRNKLWRLARRPRCRRCSSRTAQRGHATLQEFRVAECDANGWLC